MRKQRKAELWLCTGGILAVGLSLPGWAAAQTLSGSVSDANFGAPLATQTIATGFGTDTSNTNGTSAGASEMDDAYATVANGDLYILLTGNYEDNGNHINLFIDDGRAGGQNTLTLSTGTALDGMNGSTFSPGFNATYALDANDYQGTVYVNAYDLVRNTSVFSNNSMVLNNGVGGFSGASNGLGIAVGLNNTNVSVQNGTAAGQPINTTAAEGVTTGLDYAIPLGLLGSPAPGTTIEMVADINGGGDSYLSNQFLPGLAVGTGNVGGGGTYSGPSSGAFNLSSLTNDFFSVTVPTTLPNGTWLATSGGSWQTAADWSNSAVPNAPGASATFNNAAAPGTVVSLDGPISVGAIQFASTNSYTVSAGSGGILTMDNGTAGATITTLSGSQLISAPVVLNSNTTVSISQDGDILTLSGNVSGTGGLIIDTPNGAGTAFSAVVLSGSNSYSGGTTIQDGVLQLASSTALPAGTALTLYATSLPDAILDLNGNNATVSSLTEVTGTLTASLNAVGEVVNSSTTAGLTTLTYDGAAANPSTFGGAITDSSSTGGNQTELVVAAGSLTLTGSNTYGGGTLVDPGASLTIASTLFNGTAFPSGGNITNNGTFGISLDIVTLGSVKGAGTTIIADGASVTATNFTQGALVDDGTLDIIGNGVAGPISDDGNGTLQVDLSFQLATGSGASEISNLGIAGGGVMDLNGNNLTVASFNSTGGATILNNNSSSSATLIVASTGNTEFDGSIQNGAPPPIPPGVNPGLHIASGYITSLTVSQNQLTLTGSNTYTGSTTINSGADLQISGQNALSPVSPIVNNGTLDIESNAVSVAANITGTGALTIGANSTSTLQLAQASSYTTGISNTIGSITVNSGSSLDLTNNGLRIVYGSNTDPITSVVQYLTDGYNSGWAGGAIMSSTVAGFLSAHSAITYDVGYIDSALPPVNFAGNYPSGTIEILPTVAGDATLTGVVNFYDFQDVLSNFGKSNAAWDQGDFNYSGTVGFFDFQVVLSNFGKGASSLTSAELATLNNFAEQHGEAVIDNPGVGLSLVSVPEPASIGLLGMAGAGLLARRRRNRR